MLCRVALARIPDAARRERLFALLPEARRVGVQAGADSGGDLGDLVRESRDRRRRRMDKLVGGDSGRLPPPLLRWLDAKVTNSDG